MQAHLKTERYLKSLKSENTEGPNRKSLTFTAIREGTYSESFPMYTGFPDLQNLPKELKIPYDGSGPGIAFAKIDELGKATARLVKEYLDGMEIFKYKDQVMLLSGPKFWSLADTVKLMEKLKGKKINLKRVSEVEYGADPRFRIFLALMDRGMCQSSGRLRSML